MTMTNLAKDSLKKKKKKKELPSDFLKLEISFLSLEDMKTNVSKNKVTNS
jgi:hypothetical protein